MADGCQRWYFGVHEGVIHCFGGFLYCYGGFNLDFRIIVGTDSLDHQRYGIDQMFIVMQRTSLLIQCT
jgi:hypothetical protein